MTRWAVGDPEPDGAIRVRGKSGMCWWRYLGAWRHGGMDAFHAIPWDRALVVDGPFREIRLVGGKWLYADEIEIPTPRVWALPDEPGPEVTAVRDASGRRWERRPALDRWECEQKLAGLQVHESWERLFRAAGPLTDATGETA